MAGGYGLGADLPRDRHEPRELQLGVARDTGNRSASGEIIFDERANNTSLEFIFEIQHVERNAKVFGHASRVVHVVERAASRRLRLLIGRKPPALIPQLHREADDVVPLALQYCRGDRAVHTAAHCYSYCHCVLNLFLPARLSNAIIPLRSKVSNARMLI